MKKILEIIVNNFFSIFKIDNNKIVFQGNQNMIDGNPRAIYEYMKKFFPSYRLICIVNKDVDISSIDSKDCVFYKTFKGYYHLATARYWIRSQSFGGLLKKRKGQVYIQTWHGHGALKKMSYDVDSLKATNNGEELEHVKDWDYFIATDELDGNVIKSSTNYKGKILELGAASMDLLNQNNQEKSKMIKKELGIKNNKKKIVLYAPTFREKDLESNLVTVPIEKLRDLDEYIFLVRLHPLIENKVDKKIFSKNIINVCDYYDVSNLLLISDILISDYSSIIYEFAILNRPMILYAYDYDLYQKERGFYIDYFTLPCPICYTQDELFECIKKQKYNLKKYQNQLKSFNNKYNKLNDGHATERIVNLITTGYFLKDMKEDL